VSYQWRVDATALTGFVSCQWRNVKYRKLDRLRDTMRTSRKIKSRYYKFYCHMYLLHF